MNLIYGVAHSPKPGFAESGDFYVVEQTNRSALIAVIDGLGHGGHGAAAARAAGEALRKHAHDTPLALMQRCHQALNGTRGAVMSIARLENGEMTWLGVGNVEGVLLRADLRLTRERLLLRGGVVGYRMPPLRAFCVPLTAGDTLLFVTDGIKSAFLEDLPAADNPQAVADDVLARHNRQTDDALVLVARYQP
ncbi:MAG: SpoIIE family protein phosphatase [Chloroflexi bacterium]|nr:SpoIIE family protein phosphatase [Chloroflexota bacterium]